MARYLVIGEYVEPGPPRKVKNIQSTVGAVR